MISTVIATHDSERALVATLAALVPAAIDGLVREVIVTDAGSRDGTAQIAEVAGAHFLSQDGPLGERLRASAARARGRWLLFLVPGMVLDAAWVDEAGRFVRETELAGRTIAAVFRRGGGGSVRRATLMEAFALAATAFGAGPRPRPDQGLLIATRHYDALGGHAAERVDPETDLLRRLGRRNIVTLRSAATLIM